MRMLGLILDIVVKIENKTQKALSPAGHIGVPQNFCAELPQASGLGGGGYQKGGWEGHLELRARRNQCVCCFTEKSHATASTLMMRW